MPGSRCGRPVTPRWRRPSPGRPMRSSGPSIPTGPRPSTRRSRRPWPRSRPSKPAPRRGHRPAGGRGYPGVAGRRWLRRDGRCSAGDAAGDVDADAAAFSPAVGLNFAFVTPFAMTTPSQFRPGPPPALNSPEYTAAYDEVKSVGAVDSTTRTPDQTEYAHFWADLPGLTFTPPGHWNQTRPGRGDVAAASAWPTRPGSSPCST